jgi:integrase
MTVDSNNSNGLRSPSNRPHKQRTSSLLDSQACEVERVRALESIKLHVLPFRRASELWLEQHRRYIKPNTLRSYVFAVKVLNDYFGDLIVRKIHIGHVRQYQQDRAHRAGAYRINGELSCFAMVLKEAKCWKPIEELYRPMPVPKRRAGHSISADEERRLREIAFSRPKWRLAGHCMMVMLSTTMGFGELRNVRRRDVDLHRRCVEVREGAKNDYRDRTIPLNSAALESMSWLIDRWEHLGGTCEDQFILPHRPRKLKGPWIFDEPMTAIRSAFRNIRKAAGLPHFRVYDCRVQAITKLLSNPKVSPQVSKEIAGHISQAMQDRYSIQQFDTKLAALEALESPDSYRKRPSDNVTILPLDAVREQMYSQNRETEIPSRFAEYAPHSRRRFDAG